ncbi:flagellar basal body-associated FliL family protein [uncultured Desulfovibrio sp.]|uniref:flagellar basal body-associated FliL family protein n=1 Tax=uncultured Desulfovibrio sp. TaxID=167968 RepID=UPI002624AD65|nr:flagellar basal body-associated FliL family protein [uncultured Desulfovibrio sp.]
MADDKVKEKSDIQVEVASPASASAGGKVELDLDDAPFLREPEEKPLPPVERRSSAPAPVVKEAPKSKKKLIISGIGLFVILAATAVWWFFFRVPPPVVEPPKPEVIVVKPPEAAPVEQDFIFELEPFWVPVKDDKGNTNFLVCRFSTISKSEMLNKEIEKQLMTVRDAMYYYLRNKSLDFLLAAANRETIKKDLTSVVNSYLTLGQIEDVLMESYLGH